MAFIDTPTGPARYREWTVARPECDTSGVCRHSLRTLTSPNQDLCRTELILARQRSALSQDMRRITTGLTQGRTENRVAFANAASWHAPHRTRTGAKPDRDSRCVRRYPGLAPHRKRDDSGLD
ncbi:hypothetical protein QAD02_012358 [Eretmocerus hayati]|uniref:Uncharacterized protein n=1 Tax=Eretmocerus hayati TaxID=131215 RepID=A0ACC2P166_9HYME|nr:hypothetical protein QAD02_012358 [Eretmocerus hayati]